MARFFISSDQIKGEPPAEIILTGSDVRHIRDVLRLQTGESITVCDSAGREHFCVIRTVGKEEVAADIRSSAICSAEPDVPVVLYQGIPKGEKMDWIIEKCVELGVTRIVPLEMERTIVRFVDDKDRRKKQERWQRIAEAAAKQSGRGRIPEVMLPAPFRSKIQEAVQQIKIVPYENETERTLKDILRKNPILPEEEIAVLIGPEGGIAPDEIRLAEEEGFLPVTLGKRILRTETAGMAVLAVIRYETED